MRIKRGWQERFWEKVDKSGDCWLWLGTKVHNGYGQAWNGTKVVYAHRLSYSMTSDIPDGQELDHRPTCPKNCVNPVHLRPVTHKQNNENRAGAHANSKSGVRGVHWDAKRKRWCSYVKHNGKSLFVGRFKTLEEADRAVVAKRLELFTHNELDRA